MNAKVKGATGTAAEATARVNALDEAVELVSARGPTKLGTSADGRIEVLSATDEVLASFRGREEFDVWLRAFQLGTYFDLIASYQTTIRTLAEILTEAMYEVGERENEPQTQPPPAGEAQGLAVAMAMSRLKQPPEAVLVSTATIQPTIEAVKKAAAEEAVAVERQKGVDVPDLMAKLDAAHTKVAELERELTNLRGRFRQAQETNASQRELQDRIEALARLVVMAAEGTAADSAIRAGDEASVDHIWARDERSEWRTGVSAMKALADRLVALGWRYDPLRD